MAKPVRLAPSQIDEAGAVLARAFQDDPLQRYILPDEEERRRVSPPFFSILVRYGVLAAEAWTTEDQVRGVALWWPPEHPDVVPEKLEAAGFNTLPALMGEDAFGRFTEVLDHLAPLHSAAAPDPHWYAMVLGVDPRAQGQGIGRRLLQHVFDRADAGGQVCYLETTQPKNVAFYRNSGMDVVEHGMAPGGGPEYWTFRRMPRR